MTFCSLIHAPSTFLSVLSALAIPFWIASSKLFAEVDVSSMTLATDMTKPPVREAQPPRAAYRIFVARLVRCRQSLVGSRGLGPTRFKATVLSCYRWTSNVRFGPGADNSHVARTHPTPP